jgi:hypothetical protein
VQVVFCLISTSFFEAKYLFCCSFVLYLSLTEPWIVLQIGGTPKGICWAELEWVLKVCHDWFSHNGKFLLCTFYLKGLPSQCACRKCPWKRYLPFTFVWVFLL